MATAADIGWGKYRDFEGPFYRGKHSYKLPPDPSEDAKIMAVITATEGGHYDAYNGYDRCICTSGLIQWCEAGQYSVSDMLGRVANSDRKLILAVDGIAASYKLDFKKNEKGNWRFFFRDARGEVDRQQEQQQMFLLQSTGKVGSWDEPSRAYAKAWAAAISTVWENPIAQRLQADYTAQRLMGFALPYARALFARTPATPVGRAFRAAFLSFAANNPTWASRHLEIAVKEHGEAFDQDWLIAVLKQLTFGPKVTIYPHRYKAIRPVLEQLYGVALPDLAEELERWQGEQAHELFWDTTTLQETLLTLGYDLGPAGADGIYGNKTREAVLLFEQQNFGEKNRVPAEHVDGMFDEWTAKKMEEVLELRGIQELGSAATA